MKMKSIKRLIANLLCVMLVVGAFVHTATPAVQVKAAETTKIMPLGDSITDCDFWRSMLFNKLTDNGYNVTSVGTRYGGHEGHSGMLVTDLAKTNNLTTWLDATNPDMVMMLFGTNDCWCDKGAKAILSAYTTLVGQMRENNPDMIIVIGKVTPLIPNFTSDFVYRAEELALAIDGWAEKLTTEQSPIYVVDQFTGFDAMTDTYDGVHPNNAGSVKMCNKWYDALSKILDGEEPEVSETPIVSEEPEVSEIPVVSEEPEVSEIPVVSETPVISETPVSSKPSTNLTLTTEVNTWSTGFTMSANVNNTSDTAVSSWKLIIDKGDFTITNAWCVELEETDDTYILTPMSWNSAINAGGYTNFGFQGTGSITNFSYTLG
nr:GDSL-type esterase/lipase family protein [uncultured Lachnoclostridium sp.]